MDSLIMSLQIKNTDKEIILDCNVWITDFLKKESDLHKKIRDDNYVVIITSYMAVEILRVLKRVATHLSVTYSELENLFWKVCSLSYIIPNFEQPFTESLITEVKRLPEFQIIAKLLNLETKDVPYIVAAYQYKAILVTNDIRSLVNKGQKIKNHLGIDVISLTEFLTIK